MRKPPFNFPSWYQFYQSTKREIFMKELDKLQVGDNLIIQLEDGTKLTLGGLKMMVLDELEEAGFVEKTLDTARKMNMPDVGRDVNALWYAIKKFYPR